MASATDTLTGLPFGTDRDIDMFAYYDVLGRIHRQLSPRTYLEIGIRQGHSLKETLDTTRCVGVDPAPMCDERIHPNLRVVKDTSDNFFQRYKPEDITGISTFDLVFIDGMHLFEYAFRDFVNAEPLCTKDSVIVAHDCLPHNAITAERDRKTAFWTGDVWKLIPALQKYRPDLRIEFSTVDPTGIAVIRNLDPNNTILRDNLDRIIAEFMPLTYDDYLKFPKPPTVKLDSLKVGMGEAIKRQLFHFTESFKTKSR